MTRGILLLALVMGPLACQNESASGPEGTSDTCNDTRNTDELVDTAAAPDSGSTAETAGDSVSTADSGTNSGSEATKEESGDSATLETNGGDTSSASSSQNTDSSTSSDSTTGPGDSGFGETDTETLSSDDWPAACYVPGVPYFYQYDNAINPGGSCQNTSTAMVLAYFGWNGEPDDISEQWGTSYAQDPEGLAEVFNDYAEQMGIPQRDTAITDGSFQGLIDLVCSGKPVIVHGYFTGYGHVVVVTGYDETGRYFIVNDPAGQWSEVFMGGYSGSGSGHGAQYDEDAFYAAVATSDGSTFLPLWYHQIDP